MILLFLTLWGLVHVIMAAAGRRRRRSKGACPNALFVRWLEEWRDEAREKGMKAQYGYAKALESLKKYPLPLQSGQEARVLSHIGEKLAQKLDKKLEEYRSNMKDHSDEAINSESSGPSDLQDHTSTNSRRAGSAQDGSNPPAVKRRKARDEYIPFYRSGPYALLVALHNAAEQRPGYPGYLHKLELQSEAQKYCDTSFTVPNAGSYYTAWSSMSSLTRRGLINKVGNPARYVLTEAGAELAVRLLEGSAVVTETAQTPTPASVSLTAEEVASSDDGSISSQEILPEKVSCSSEAKRNHSKVCELAFWYVTPEERCVTRKDQAAVTFNDKLMVGFLVKCSQKQLEGSGIAYTLDDSRKPVEDLVYAYISNEDAPDISTPPSKACIEGLSELGKLPKRHVLVDSDDSSDVEEVLPLSERVGLHCMQPSKKGTDVPSTRKEVTSVHKDVTSVHKDVPSVHKDVVHKDVPSQISVHAAGNPVDKPLCISPLRSNKAMDQHIHLPEAGLTPNQRAGLAAIRRNTRDALFSEGPSRDACSSGGTGGTASVTQLVPRIPSFHAATPSLFNGGMATSTVESCSTSKPAADLRSPLCVLRPGQFEVVLCVDCSESSSNRRSASQFRGMLLQELGKNGIRFDVRRLNVGDFMWIAKEIVPPQPGQLSLPQSCEIALEHIVERKRMDDLAFSICDGRFHEQKFRLKHCGVKYPVYLVEDYGSHTHLQLDARALEQAITNTQVIDKFFIKRTKDLRGSVEYLTLMTRSMQKYYMGKSIKAYPLDTVLLLNKCEKPSDAATVCSTMFEEFNTASLKNKVLTTYEMFAMHLMPISGVTAEKAHAILEKFPTVASLRHSYKQCLSEKERENLISDIRAGHGQRRIGPSISRLIYSLYWKS